MTNSKKKSEPLGESHRDRFRVALDHKIAFLMTACLALGHLYTVLLAAGRLFWPGGLQRHQGSMKTGLVDRWVILQARTGRPAGGAPDGPGPRRSIQSSTLLQERTQRSWGWQFWTASATMGRLQSRFWKEGSPVDQRPLAGDKVPRPSKKTAPTPCISTFSGGQGRTAGPASAAIQFGLLGTALLPDGQLSPDGVGHGLEGPTLFGLTPETREYPFAICEPAPNRPPMRSKAVLGFPKPTYTVGIHQPGLPGGSGQSPWPSRG